MYFYDIVKPRSIITKAYGVTRTNIVNMSPLRIKEVIILRRKNKEKKLCMQSVIYMSYASKNIPPKTFSKKIKKLSDD